MFNGLIMVFIFSFYFYLDTWVTTQKIAGRSIYIGSKSDKPWSTLVEEGKERYRPPGKLTLELVLANQNKLLCL